jgi:eukaryotic-like serine/threonine-protein kinase
MTAQGREDWARIREVFDAAMAQPAERRASFVAESCHGESAIHDQVVALLAFREGAGGFLAAPAVNLVENLPRADLTGRPVGPYHLGARIGQGGMGDVYRARDTRLDRSVAIKVLTLQTSAGQPSHDRFVREARAVAALNHPHICTLYDVGTHDGLDFLVMEFLEGETLATRLQRGRLSLAHLFEFAIQIASALDVAHKSGIIHRDLTTRNIMLTPAGAKLLDFGLAKTTTAIVDTSVTASRELTAPGTILGTLRYMAPEQLEGRNADARTDLFAFGCVLYEMVTGKKAFEARNSATLLTAIMALAPTPVREVVPGAPPAVEYIIARCLEKDPDDRWQTARDLLAELKRTAIQNEIVPAPRREGRWTARRTALSLAVLAAVGAALVTSLMWPRSLHAGSPTWLSILPPAGGFDLSPNPTVSPDDRYVVFKAEDVSHRSLLWLKDLSGPGIRPLAGTDGVESTQSPFWSPDSRSIGFFAHGQLKRVDIDGSAPQVLAPAAESRGGTWSPSGVIVFDNGDRLLHRVSPSGGASPLVPGTGKGQVRLFPHALPDGRHYLFTSRNVNGLGEGIYVASLDAPDVRRVSDAWSNAAYAAGHLLFGRQGALFAQPFHVSRLVVTGEPRQLVDGLGVGCCTPLSFAFSASAGVLTFWHGSTEALTQLEWIGRDGARPTTVGEPGHYLGLALSADGRRVALERGASIANGYDLWLLDLASGARATRFTLDGKATVPVWSPDGTRLLVMSRARGLVAMPWRGGSDSTVVADSASMWPSDWSADGRYVAFFDAPAGWRLLTAPADGRGKPTPYRQGLFALQMMRFFPGGGWVAYVSEESGQVEVYLDSFPTAGEKTRVSTDGGSWPVWRHDGKELYYLASDRGLMAVPVRTESGGLRVSPATRLFEAPPVNPDWSRAQFASNADGSKFLFNARVDDRTPVGLTVVANWPALLVAAQPRH